MAKGETGKIFSKLGWTVLIIYALLIAVVAVAMFTDIFAPDRQARVPELVWVFIAAAIIITLALILRGINQLTDSAESWNQSLREVIEQLHRHNEALSQTSQDVRLTETAKAIAFRDINRQTLREVVFDKLAQHDFETTYQIIDEVMERAGYTNLAKQLRAQADRCRDATDAERAAQIISHIEKLLDNHQWLKASTQIERLISTYPDNNRAKAMRQKLVDKKAERKKILLTAWDDAVKREATDRSLEILKELDQYLSPNEALALQEAASDVFRTKLHNLGVRFSLAVSAKNWKEALEAGRRIMSDFPNSRMAAEIKDRWDALEQKTRTVKPARQ